MASGPMYDFRQGISLSETEYYRSELHNVVAHSDFHISAAQLQALEFRLEEPDPDYARVMQELDDSDMVYLTNTGHHGISQDLRCEYSLFNRTAESSTITLMVMGWGNDYRDPSTGKSLAAFALAKPDQRFFVMNFLNNGRSSNLPVSTAIQMTYRGSYRPAGELYAQAIRNIAELRDTDGLDIISESRGDRLATGAVAEGLAVRSGTFCDGPGMLRFGVRGLRNAFLTEANVHAPHYREENCTDETPAVVSQEVKDRIRNRSALTHYLLEPIALSMAGQEDDIAAALPFIRDWANFITLAESEVTDVTARTQAIENFANYATRPPEITHTIAHGLTHLYGVGSRAARAYLLGGSPERS